MKPARAAAPSSFAYWAFAVLLCLVAFGFQGSRSVWEPDEGFYIVVAKEMVQSADFIVPRLHHVPFLDKPPLTYWGIACGMELLGMNEWSARGFHAVCLILISLIVAATGSSMWGRTAGLRAGAIFASMLIPIAAGWIVTPDLPLTTCVAAAFYCFWMSVREGGTHAALWKLALCACFGLGFLAKGPAMLILAAPMFAFLATRRRIWSYFFTIWSAVGLVVFALVGLTWYAALANRVPGALEYFWDNQVAGRLVTAKYSRNPEFWKGPLIYLPTIVLGSLPWSLRWIPVVRRHASFSSLRRVFSRDPAALLVALWITIPCVILMAASSKLTLYILPVFPALALATSRVWRSGGAASEGAEPERVFSKRRAYGIAAWFAFMLCIKGLVALYPIELKNDSRALWEAIRAEVPDGPGEIVAVDERVNGVSFYTDVPFEIVTTKDDPYPFFATPRRWKDKARELADHGHSAVVITRNGNRAEHVCRALDRVDVHYRRVEIAFDRTLVITE